jgi:hypothetical protein
VRRGRTGPQHQASWAVPCRSGEAVQPGSACRRSALPAAPAQSDGPRTPFLERSPERRPFPMPRPARRPSSVAPLAQVQIGGTPERSGHSLWRPAFRADAGVSDVGKGSSRAVERQASERPDRPNVSLTPSMISWLAGFGSKTAEPPKTRARAWRSRRGATTAPRARQAARRLSAEDLPVLRSATMSKETFCPSLRLLIPARSTALM